MSEEFYDEVFDRLAPTLGSHRMTQNEDVLRQAKQLIRSDDPGKLVALEELLNANPVTEEILGKLLHKAILTECAESVSWLISFGADPNFPCGVFGETPLCLAISDRKTDIARILLKQGADPNLVADENVVLLAIGRNTYNEPLETLKLLDEHGVNLGLTDNEGEEWAENGLDRAIELEMADVVEFLVSKEVKRAQPAKNYDASILEERAIPNPNLQRPKKDLGEICTLQYAGSDIRSWQAVIEREGCRPVSVELFPDNAKPTKKMLDKVAEFVASVIESNEEFRQQAIAQLVESRDKTREVDAGLLVNEISLFRIEYSSADTWTLYFDIDSHSAEFGDVLFLCLSNRSDGNLDVLPQSSSRLAVLAEDFLGWPIPAEYETNSTTDKFVASIANWRFDWQTQCRDFGPELLETLDASIAWATECESSSAAYPQRFYHQLVRILSVIRELPRY